ncbi:sensor histidine kinase [Cohnella fermenti]|uniref:histidine kinase n=1 Tax=Cohnella fermenti TaxID=2565925 RepID=A0A4V3WE04_9BACL|nr:HAMP domain-containing sensor histidine kinase [Cohnella fermenti]THF74358.1 HAMP domain-containing histidine kinase [Cohnella fermenti]
MVFIFLVLLITAIILWRANRKDEATRWAVLFLLCGSSGSLGVTIEQSIFPALERYHIGHEWINGILFDIQVYASLVNQLLFPYAVTMYAVVESELLPRHLTRLLTYVLPVPAIVTFLATPIVADKYRINYQGMLIWVTPYLLSACFFLVTAYLREASPFKKQHRLRIVWMVIPTVLGILSLNYVAKAMDLGIPLYRYLAVFVGFSFVAFLVFAFSDEAFGVKLRLERQRWDLAMRPMVSGASFVHHAMKQEMGKIKLLAGRTHSLADKNSSREIQRYADLIQQAASHLIHMSGRMNNQLRELMLQEEWFDLNDWINDCISSSRPILEQKRVSITQSPMLSNRLYGDRELLLEVLSNLLENAFEAMDVGGSIRIAVNQLKKWLLIEVTDTGHGMPEELRKRVFEPFFSTKLEKGNMGIGLTFCYNVMQKHGGTIRMTSKLSIGTTVTLYIPTKRVRTH